MEVMPPDNKTPEPYWQFVLTPKNSQTSSEGFWACKSGWRVPAQWYIDVIGDLQHHDIFSNRTCIPEDESGGSVQPNSSEYRGHATPADVEPGE